MEQLNDSVNTVRRFVDVDQFEFDATGRAGQFAHRAVCDEPALVECDDVVADPFNLFEHVRREHDVDPEVAVDLDDDVQHFVALHRVEAVGRFVEHDETWVGSNCLGKLDTLALAGRHGAQRPKSFFTQANQVERVACSRPGLVAGESLDFGQMANKIVGPEVVGQHVALWAVPDLGAKCGTVHVRVESEHFD